MPIEGIVPTTPLPGAKYATTGTSSATAGLDKDAFLKLLVAQLKYQNPLSPADPTQFMSQTAQFTMVEELQNMGKEQKSAALAQQISTAGSLVGKEVTWLDSDGVAKSGQVSSATIVDGSTVVVVGNAKVPIESIQSINASAAATAVDQTAADKAAADKAAADKIAADKVVADKAAADKAAADKAAADKAAADKAAADAAAADAAA
jgi:flagellar basal-body rod modification protein FlgD